ncbi:MAG TPA: protein kinase, partial [Kofleriaceae bacterium]|nr:protein kinase [Kofleriaceae bacterium]
MTLAVDPSEELAPGTRVGEYLIEKRIGVGGMGIVYGAVHPVIGKRAALKVLNARYCSDQESVQRFVREAQAVNKVGHANIVDIFSIGTLPDGRSYLVMEWLRGETLMDHLERAVLPLVQTLDILIALTRALEAAHNAGVIHRDL